jgi:hypothetical protein
MRVSIFYISCTIFRCYCAFMVFKIRLLSSESLGSSRNGFELQVWALDITKFTIWASLY